MDKILIKRSVDDRGRMQNISKEQLSFDEGLDNKKRYKNIINEKEISQFRRDGYTVEIDWDSTLKLNADKIKERQPPFLNSSELILAVTKFPEKIEVLPYGVGRFGSKPGDQYYSTYLVSMNEKNWSETMAKGKNGVKFVCHGSNLPVEVNEIEAEEIKKEEDILKRLDISF